MRIVVDDCTLVVGLSELFRQEMKIYEVANLLPLAEEACKALDLAPAAVPVEGYYTESSELEKYFRLIRALQDSEARELSPLTARDAIFQLREVLTSRAMGRVESNDRLLPRTSSPLGEALQILSTWTIDGLCEEAQKLVRKDDFGLLAVAAAAGDPVGLCAARESMALMADVELAEMQVPEFEWGVSQNVAEVASRFVSALAETTRITLPEPAPPSAHLYGQAARDAELIGRCILIGEQFGNPYSYYHWYIDLRDDQLTVKDFWSSNRWTTADLRQLPSDSRPAMGTQVGAPHLENEPKGKGFDPREGDQKKNGRKGWLARLFQRGL